MNWFELIRGAMLLDPNAFDALAARPDGLRLSLWVVFLAGLSSAVGQSVVLFANRVRPGRFAASLIVSAVLFVFSALFWALSLWWASERLFGRPQDLSGAARAVGLAHAPQLLAVVVLTPYLGSFFANVLSVWTFLAVGVGASRVFELDLAAGLLCAALGWLLLQVLQRTIGRPLVWLARRVRRWTAGRPLTPGGTS